MKNKVGRWESPSYLKTLSEFPESIKISRRNLKALFHLLKTLFKFGFDSQTRLEISKVPTLMHRQTGIQTYRQTDGRTDGHADGRTDERTGRQASRQAGRHTDIHTGRQTDRHTEVGIFSSLISKTYNKFVHFNLGLGFFTVLCLYAFFVYAMRK